MQTVYRLLIITIISAINTLFAWKYASRLDNTSYVLIALFCSSAFPFLIYSAFHYRRIAILQGILNSKAVFVALIIVTTVFALIFFKLYPQELLRVDRFEMIRLFWENFFSSKCPYCPRSAGTNIPGPFPFYFFGALPFYLAGEIGLYSITGFLLFAAILGFTRHITFRLKNAILLLLITSPAFLFEISCRSTNFLNSTLLLLCTLLISKINLTNWKNLIITGFLTGLILSTRSFSFLIIALAFIYRFKYRFFTLKTVGVYATAMMTFILTFIPVIVICKSTFLQFNPFVIQASLAPPLLFITAALISALLAFKAKNNFSLSAINGFVLLFLVAGYSLNLFMIKGFTASIFSSAVDISYFSLTFPFLLFSFGKADENSCNQSSSQI